MYRIVAADSRAPRDGRFIESLGYYHPLTNPATVVVKRDRIDHWLQHGAQPTDVVARILRSAAEPLALEPAVAETPAPRAPRRGGTTTPVALAGAGEAPVDEDLPEEPVTRGPSSSEPSEEPAQEDEASQTV